MEKFQDSDVGVHVDAVDRAIPINGILTPVGPRDPQWFEQLIETPDQDRIFPSGLKGRRRILTRPGFVSALAESAGRRRSPKRKANC